MPTRKSLFSTTKFEATPPVIRSMKRSRDDSTESAEVNVSKKCRKMSTASTNNESQSKGNDTQSPESVTAVIKRGRRRNSREDKSSKGTSKLNRKGVVQDKNSEIVPSHKVRKLAPPRPFPTVSTSVPATGPKSQHNEGKNRLCITRKTSLGGYMRRCKDLVIKDGYAITQHYPFLELLT